MLPPISTGWPTARSASGSFRAQARKPWLRPCGERTVRARFLDYMPLNLAGVVRDIKQKLQVATWEEVSKNPACVVAENSRLASAQLIAARMAPR